MHRDGKDPFVAQLQVLLDKHKVREALDLIRMPEIRERLANDSELMWDTIPVICSRLRSLNEFRFKTFGICQEILLDLAHLCRPKEVLISLLAELEFETHNMVEDINGNKSTASATELKYQVDDSCFKAILKPLQYILIQMPNKRNETLKWVLSTLNNHVLKIPVPKEQQVEPGRERVIYDGDPRVRRLHLVLPIYLDFLEAFVDEFDRSRKESRLKPLDEVQEAKVVPHRDILLRALMALLFHPFMFLDLTLILKDPKAKQEAAKIENNNVVEEKPSRIDYSNTSILSNALASKPINKYVWTFLKNPSIAGGPSLLVPELDDSLTCAIRTLELISVVEPNIYRLYDDFDGWRQSISENDDEEVDSELKSDAATYAVAVAAYLAVGQNLYPTDNFVPSVYSHSFAFEKHLPYIYVLLERTENLAHEKGLVLADKLISLISAGSLSISFADILRTYPIEKSLINIMRFSTLSTNRKKALGIFKLYLSRYTNDGRYQLLYRTLAEPGQHTVVSGLALTLYKDFILSESDASAFLGVHLQRFLKKAIAICLPEGTESDLIENNDTILGTLNLIRFLCIRDPKTVNGTKIWDLREYLRKGFLKSLREAVDLSRTHFNIELRQLREEAEKPKTLQKKAKANETLEINVLNNCKGDSNMFELPADHESEVIQVALIKFDMMESVLVRVSELID